MNWDAIGAVSDLVGSVGVIVSLIYLGAQIRQNTRSVQAGTFQSVTEGLAAASFQLAQATAPPDRFLLFVGTVRRYENLHFQVRRGLLGKADVVGFMGSLVGFLSSERYREYWSKSAQLTFHPEFVAYVENEILPRSSEGQAIREHVLHDNPESAA
jgi:hypothetical protein